MSVHQISYRGLTLGAGTDYLIEEVSGILNRSVAVNTPDLPRYHGGLVGASYHDPRVITFKVNVVGEVGSDLADKRNALRAAFQPLVDSEDEFVFQTPGDPEQLVFARCSKFDSPQTKDSEAGSVGVSVFDVELIASDPAIYDSAESTAQADVFVAPGGISYPVSYPTPYGAGGTGGGVNVMLGGFWESWPVFRISGQTGTLTNPIIEQVTQGTRLALNAHGGVTMTNGQILVVDTHPARRSIAFTTGASRYGRLSDDSVWAPFQPGMNEVRFRASGTTDNAVLTITARSARI